MYVKRVNMDIEQIKSLIELMVDHDLSRLELQDGESKILLRRGHDDSAPQMVAAPPAMPHMLPVAPADSSVELVAEEPKTDEVYIRSPMVGTFYTSVDPESPPFVSVGDSIGPEQVVCLVEAMKVFNEIKAEISGGIIRVLVKNAEAVEFDQPLFAVTPS